MSRPQRYGAYDLLERINVGGMAEVFRAVHRDTGRLVAVKRILPSVAEDEEFISMFRDEASIASQLDHPNIAKIFDIGRVDASYFIALEYVHGRDMRTIFDNAARYRTPLALDLVFHVLLSLCKGLDYAHLRKDANGRPLSLVHRDVSPQNILVSYDGDVKLIDFGIAKAAGKLARTQVGSIKGKFGYMSPEQVRGLPVDRRSDIFSVGTCLWEFLTMQRLFQGDNEIIVMERIRNADVPPPRTVVPSLPVEVEQIVMRSLAKDADERYSSTSEFHAELSAYAHTVGMPIQRERAADFMRRTFAKDAPSVSSREEAHVMADNKGGSDLDVFEGLARKPQTRGATPPPTAPLPSSPGRPGPAPPPARARTLLGVAPMPPPPTRPAIPSNPPGRVPPLPSNPGMPLPAPPQARGSGVLPAVMPPPGRPSVPPPPPRAAGPLPAPVAPPSAPFPLANPVGGPPPPPPGKPATVDMDWDDEDEKTQVYDKAEDMAASMMGRPAPAAGTPAPVSGAAALLARSGNVAPPIPRAPSFPPGRLPMPSQPNMQMQMPAPQQQEPAPIPASAQPTTLVATQKSSSKLPLVLVALVGVAAIAAGLLFFLRPSEGVLKVYVSGPGGSDVRSVSVFVDGLEVCNLSPCTVEKLKAGIHDVKATAAGYQMTAPKGIDVKAGEQTKLEFELQVASEGTGFKVASAQEGIKLFVDDKEIGPLPQTLKDLTPGEHKIRFVGSDRYKADERTVNVVPNKIEDLGDVKLDVAKGKATLELVTFGARILLVPSDGEKRKIDERMFKNGKLSIDIDTAQDWRVEATKKGYQDLSLPISFKDGDAEKTFKIELKEIEVAAAPDKGPAPGGKTPPPGPGTTSTAVKTGDAKLNINSIPPAAVLVDGRPMGLTPKMGVSVSPGTHTITFVHPEKGRKSTSVTVGPGETKGVGVRF